MRYNQFDFDYALESMNSVDLSAQANRLADSGDEDFADAVLEAYEDMYAALEAGDLEEALDIYAALEEAEEVVEEDPDVARKAKRKALLKKVGKGAGAFAGSVAASAAAAGMYDAHIHHYNNKVDGSKGGVLNAGKDAALNGAKYGVGIAAMTAAGRGAYGVMKKRRAAKAAAAKQEAEAQEGYGYFNR